MSEWLKNHQSEINTLRMVSDEIYLLSNSFLVTGNNIVANKLRYYVEIIRNSATALDDIMHDKLNESFKMSQESSINVLEAVLAGIKVGEKK